MYSYNFKANLFPFAIFMS